MNEVAHRGPTVPFRWLDTLWIQLTGTLCNIACRHCFISCGPRADDIPLMTVSQVERALNDGVALGMRQVYFTGGEPFLHPHLRELVERTLALAPLTIVTNGILIDQSLAEWVASTFSASRYSFDLRVSLDGMTREQNDIVRGRGTFEKIVGAIQRLGACGYSPVVTVVEHEDGLAALEARAQFLDFVRGLGIPQPRVKFLPLLRIGRESHRTHGYEQPEALGEEPLLPEVESSLLCASGRIVTAQGAFTCPILVKDSTARLGSRLGDGMKAIRLGWSACQTCVFDGLRCNT